MPETLRSCIVAEKDHTFISLDASQIELRVLAIMSQDPHMLADLAGGDLHLATALRMFGQATREDALAAGIGEEDIPEWIASTMKKRRYDAKQCNFAIVYGADAFKLAQMFECSLEEAERFMGEHRAAYPVLYAWMEAQVDKAKEQGFTVNLFGRIRPLPELYSGSFKIREKAEREVVNTIVQGTAVDIVKQAMLVLRGLLDRTIRLVLQVHDEMVWECPDSLLPEALEHCQELSGYFPSYPFKICTGKVYGEVREITSEH